jgi:hypothetical protein
MTAALAKHARLRIKERTSFIVQGVLRVYGKM